MIRAKHCKSKRGCLKKRHSAVSNQPLKHLQNLTFDILRQGKAINRSAAEPQPKANPSTQSASSGDAGMNCSWKLSNAHNVHLEVELSRLSTLFSTKPKSVSGEERSKQRKDEESQKLTTETRRNSCLIYKPLNKSLFEEGQKQQLATKDTEEKQRSQRKIWGKQSQKFVASRKEFYEL